MFFFKNRREKFKDIVNQQKGSNLEDAGNDPATSHMLSVRPTIWARKYQNIFNQQKRKGFELIAPCTKSILGNLWPN